MGRGGLGSREQGAGHLGLDDWIYYADFIEKLFTGKGEIAQIHTREGPGSVCVCGLVCVFCKCIQEVFVSVPVEVCVGHGEAGGSVQG